MSTDQPSTTPEQPRQAPPLQQPVPGQPMQAPPVQGQPVQAPPVQQPGQAHPDLQPPRAMTPQLPTAQVQSLQHAGATAWRRGKEALTSDQAKQATAGVRQVTAGAVAKGARQLLTWSLAAAGVVAVGSLGPWASLLGMSVSGTAGDGMITLLMALVVAGVALAVRTQGGARLRWLPWVAVGASALSLLTSGVDFARVADATSSVGFGASVGWGLVLAFLGSLAMVVLTTLAALAARKEASVPAPPVTPQAPAAPSQDEPPAAPPHQ